MIRRHIETNLKAALGDTPVALLVGARQTGKSTLARTLVPKNRYMTLDDATTLASAKADPTAFVEQFDTLVVIDTPREQNAVNEARRLGIPVVAIVDTNADPEMIDYPIAGNDDAIRAIRVILQKLVDAIVLATSETRTREQVLMAGVSA